MTEKRYVEKLADGREVNFVGIFDNENSEYLNIERIENRLNEQHETITRLKKENEQLKKELFELKMSEERSCGHCKHFQLDGMFGIWCDINDTDYLRYKGEEDCPNFEKE